MWLSCGDLRGGSEAEPDLALTGLVHVGLGSLNTLWTLCLQGRGTQIPEGASCSPQALGFPSPTL